MIFWPLIRTLRMAEDKLTKHFRKQITKNMNTTNTFSLGCCCFITLLHYYDNNTER